MTTKTGLRYQSHQLTEGQFEKGSSNRVLKNLLVIKSKREMDKLEAESLEQTHQKLIQHYDQNHRFTADDICSIHRAWLGHLYAWAGEYRRVNMSKGTFMFAAAQQIPTLMADFEKKLLKKLTPTSCLKPEEKILAIAKVHVELVLIHPFREGNGRVARLFSTLMALQAGLPVLDFRQIKGRKKQAYFAAVQAGLDRNYVPMEKIFTGVVSLTLKRAFLLKQKSVQH